jgi:hypothetical protein
LNISKLLRSKLGRKGLENKSPVVSYIHRCLSCLLGSVQQFDQGEKAKISIMSFDVFNVRGVYHQTAKTLPRLNKIMCNQVPEFRSNKHNRLKTTSRLRLKPHLFLSREGWARPYVENRCQEAKTLQLLPFSPTGNSRVPLLVKVAGKAVSLLCIMQSFVADLLY